MNKKDLKYFCEECGKKICHTTALHGSGLCGSCSQMNRKLSKQTKQKISKSREIYSDILTKEFLLKEYLNNRKSVIRIAKETGCSECPIRRKLKEYNIRKINLNKGENNPCFAKIRTQNEKNKQSKSMKEYYRNHIVWNKNKTCPQLAGKNNGMFGKITHAKAGEYKNIKMRSTWETKYAKYLDKNNIKWQYEPKAFDLGTTTYRPDFYLLETNEYIEIKGYWREDAKIKFELFKKNYPNQKIKLLMKPDLQKLEIKI